jgi:lipopolysaccharide export LptBFGC system permease protein LptF
MWTLHSYLVRQVLATCLLTVATFTGILLLGNVLRDVFDMVASGRVDARTALEAILLLIPYALAFALPIGMLTGSLLVFSRLSVDQELTAIRAGGISIVAAVAPVVLLAAIMTGLNAWLNMEVGPNCKQAFRRGGALRPAGQPDAVRAGGPWKSPEGHPDLRHDQLAHRD